MDIHHYQSTLEKAGIVFEQGLTLQEVRQIEAHYRFLFPPDYRDFLMNALPVSNKKELRPKGFVDWRNGNEAQIFEMLSWPYKGICFDIEHNGFWLPGWGVQPEKLEDSLSVAKDAINRAPVLIPIYDHRYIPSKPEEAGNPILSVWQTDIICYGRDLYEYLENEFGYYFYGQSRYQVSEPIKTVEFWSEFF